MNKFEKAIFSSCEKEGTNNGTYVKEIDNGVFEKVEIREFRDHNIIDVRNYVVNFNELTEAEINNELNFTDYTVDDLKQEFNDKYVQAICEFFDGTKEDTVFLGNLQEGYNLLKTKFGIEFI